MDFLCRDVDETKSWMNEKDTALLSDDYGRDLASVQALQRKHEGLERDLAALEDRVTALGEEARRLQGKHPSSADQIAAKQAEIVGLWEGLKHKVCVCCMLACGRGSNTRCVCVCVLHAGLWEGLKHKVCVCVACWPVGGAQTYSSLLLNQASKRGARLEDAQCFQKFLGDYRLVTITACILI